MPLLVEIVFSNTRARIRSKDRAVYGIVDKALCYYVEGYRFMPKYRSGRWDGKIHLFHRRDASFPAGCVERVRALLDSDYTVKLHDRSSKPSPHPRLLGGSTSLTLRESQQEAVQAGVQQGRGVFAAATGWGKTCVMGALIAEQAVPALVLVHRRELAYQTLDRFRETLTFPRADDPFGMIGDNLWQPGLITIANFQTIYAMLKRDRKGMYDWLSQFHALHCDEAHHVPAKTLYEVCNAVAEAPYRLGYSATPFKSDRASELRLVSVTGEIIYSLGAAEAIEEGILVPPRIFMLTPRFDLLEGHDPVSGEYSYSWAMEYRTGVVAHASRNKIIAELANRCARHNLPTLVLVQHLEQGRSILRYLDDDIGEFFHGMHSTSVRKRGLKRLAEGRLPVVVASSIFDEGIDIPAIGALIVAGGYRAKHKAIQRVGRGLRAAPGKESVLVFDLDDTHAEHLAVHSRSRVAAYKKAGFDTTYLPPTDLWTEMDKGSFWDEPS